jgi:hypothetical protein
VLAAITYPDLEGMFPQPKLQIFSISSSAVGNTFTEGCLDYHDVDTKVGSRGASSPSHLVVHAHDSRGYSSILPLDFLLSTDVIIFISSSVHSY